MSDSGDSDFSIGDFTPQTVQADDLPALPPIDQNDPAFQPSALPPYRVQAPAIAPIPINWDDPAYQPPSIMGGLDWTGGDLPMLGAGQSSMRAPDIGAMPSMNPADPGFAPPSLGGYPAVPASGASSVQMDIVARARNFDPSISDHDMVLGNTALDGAARQNMPSLDRTGGTRPADENFAQFKIGDDGTVAFKPIAGSTTMSGNIARGKFDIDADAIGHSHPLAPGFSVVPGPDDYKAVEQGKPNYVVHDGNIVVIEKNDGQYQARLVAGQLKPTDRTGIQNILDRFQARSNGSD